jgi:PAS domain S-box-containing protein
MTSKRSTEISLVIREQRTGNFRPHREAAFGKQKTQLQILGLLAQRIQIPSFKPNIPSADQAFQGTTVWRVCKPVRQRSSGARYLLAAVITAPALLAYFIADPQGQNLDISYLSFTLGVLFLSMGAGLGPGLLATALFAFASAYLFLPSTPIQMASPERTARFMLLFGEGALLCFLGNLLRTGWAKSSNRNGADLYATPVLLVLAATGLKLLFPRHIQQQFPFAFYYAATAASATSGGFAPGFVATGLSILCARFFFIPPVYSLSLESADAADRVFLFVTEGVVISLVAGEYLRMRRLANRLVDQVSGWVRKMSRRAEISRDLVWEWDLPSSSSMRDDASSTGQGFSLWLRRIHPKDKLKVIDGLKAAIEEGRAAWQGEYRRFLPGRGYVRVSDHAHILRNSARKPVRVVGRSVEVTAPTPLPRGFEIEGQYRALFENNPHAMLLADGQLRIVDGNEAACDVLGYTREMLKLLTLADLVPDSPRWAMLQLTQSNASSVSFEDDCVTASGEIVRARISAAIVPGIEKTAADRIITIEEITDAEVTS